MSGKTQIFAVGQSDFFRTRLTHSLEVAQIAKGIALRVGADPDLCEAISLAHDIGHPPFGHAGEMVLRELLKDSGHFEANAQNFRILCLLEKRSVDYEGMNLTRATLDGLMKYKREIGSADRKGFYTDDERLLATTGWARRSDQSTNQTSFECQIMDHADDIAYAAHDLEDGLHAGLIDVRKAVRHQAEIAARARDFEETCTDEDVEAAIGEVALLDGALHDAAISERDSKAVRKQAASRLIGEFIRAATAEVREGNWDSDRYKYKLTIEPTMKRKLAALKAMNFRLLIEDDRVQTMDERSRRILTDLFKVFSREKPSPVQLYPEDFRPSFAAGLRERAACDYISGMTDGYAERLHQRLFTGLRVALREF